jgi:hypothetical protein
MLENDIRAVYQRMAAIDPPVPTVSIEAATRRGKYRMRVHRAGAIVTPVLAAGAVLAIAFSGVLPAGLVGVHQSPSPASHWAAAPRVFSRLRLYLTFGWLPAGMKIISGDTLAKGQYLEAGQPGSQPVIYLSEAAFGQCSVSKMQIRCAGSETATHLPSRVHDIDGHPAYMNADKSGDGLLVFQYARGGWASLVFFHHADAVRVAEHLVAASAADALRFPVQLVDLPGWQIQYATFQAKPGGLLAVHYFVLASGAAINAPDSWPTNYPWLSIYRVGMGASCSFTPRQSTRSVIAGHQVILTPEPPAHSQLCATEDGLRVLIDVSGNHPVLSASDVFAHLRLLGPNFANWTTRPAGGERQGG